MKDSKADASRQWCCTHDQQAGNKRYHGLYSERFRSHAGVSSASSRKPGAGCILQGSARTQLLHTTGGLPASFEVAREGQEVPPANPEGWRCSPAMCERRSIRLLRQAASPAAKIANDNNCCQSVVPGTTSPRKPSDCGLQVAKDWHSSPSQLRCFGAPAFRRCSWPSSATNCPTS